MIQRSIQLRLSLSLCEWDQIWLTPVRWTHWAAVTERWTKDVIAGLRTEAVLLSHTNWVSAGFWTDFSLTHLNWVLLKMVWPIVKSFPFYSFPSFLSCIFCFFLPYKTSIVLSFLTFSPSFSPPLSSFHPFLVHYTILTFTSIHPSIHSFLSLLLFFSPFRYPFFSSLLLFFSPL